MPKKEDKASIRLDLEGNIAKMMYALKEKRGVKANAELIRLLIVEEYRRRMGEP